MVSHAAKLRVLTKRTSKTTSKRRCAGKDGRLIWVEICFGRRLTTDSSKICIELGDLSLRKEREHNVGKAILACLEIEVDSFARPPCACEILLQNTTKMDTFCYKMYKTSTWFLIFFFFKFQVERQDEAHEPECRHVC